MTPERTYALMRRQGWHHVADVLEGERIHSVIVRMEFDRMVGQIGSRLLEAGCAGEDRPTPVNPDWQAYPDA